MIPCRESGGNLIETMPSRGYIRRIRSKDLRLLGLGSFFMRTLLWTAMIAGLTGITLFLARSSSGGPGRASPPSR